MTSGVTIRTNLPDVSRQLRELGETAGKRLVRASTSAAAQTIVKHVRVAIASTTVRRSGVLARSVFVARLRRQDLGSEAYRVGIRAGRTARHSKTRSGVAVTADAYSRYWVDQGHLARGPGQRIRGGHRMRALTRARLRKAGAPFVEGRAFMKRGFSAGQGPAVDAFYQRFERDFPKT